ncbi:mycothiol transferase [Streptomyces coffeae]|uniref:DUF664 domain-containing protein n=1 Tax=Streptomyces coffeae TaxID=621382 RepID=A0ABS1NBZ6_9ACTN|nr:DUF664 domain-containing protein [Streptomyces coffeae]MBL1097583.1 DUF664 domain-containing protein [Streptomyces coffeae]
MRSADLLADAFDRVSEAVHMAVDGLGEDELAERLDAGANSIAWLVWHLTRIQDDHVADAAGTEQLWTADGWYERFGLRFPPAATGYGHRGKDVAAVQADAELLTGYYDAVHENTLAYVRGLRDTDFDRIVDEAWTPAVTLGVRLVSVIADDLQHAGQAAFVRGALRRR